MAMMIEGQEDMPDVISLGRAEREAPRQRLPACRISARRHADAIISGAPGDQASEIWRISRDARELLYYRRYLSRLPASPPNFIDTIADEARFRRF